MKNKNKSIWSLLLIACTVLFGGLTLTSCGNDDDSSDQIVLHSFGPSPALRGGELRFIGQNLDKVEAIILPGSDAITDITQVNEREIKITIPQDAEPGYVTLKTTQGDIYTATMLTYEEPISVSGITTAKVKAGDQFTIEGDYLTLIKEVIFSNNITVTQENFVSQSRKKIVVIVPEEAQSGKVRVSNGAEIPLEIYAEAEANITELTMTAIAPLSVKAGASLTITGTDLNLVRAIVFAEENEVTEFVVNSDATQITVTVPADAQDGTIALVAKSQLQYTSEKEITLVVPTALTATPATEIKPGDVITIAGKDLDLVTSLLFPGLEETTAPLSVNETQLTVAMPEMAQSGELLLNLGSQKTVSVDISTKKPVVTIYNPSPVTAGGTLTIQGTDMDLVSSVTFGGGATIDVTSASQSALTVAVPVDGESGELTLIMNNGETVVAPSLDITLPVFCFIPELPADDAEIKSGTILIIEVVNGDKLTGVKVNGVSTQFILSGSALNILVPLSANGATQFTLVSSNGEVTYTIDIIYSGRVETTIFDTETDLGSWSASFRLYKESFQSVGFKAGSTLRFYLTRTADWPQVQINHANWGALLMPEGSAVTEITDVEFTQDMIDTMMGQNDGWSDTALVIQGAGAIIHKVTTIVEH